MQIKKYKPKVLYYANNSETWKLNGVSARLFNLEDFFLFSLSIISSSMVCVIMRIIVSNNLAVHKTSAVAHAHCMIHL